MRDAVAAIDGLDVDYGRPGAWRPVLRSVDLTIAPGERVALIGESGSGKSTLASLLLGERREDRRLAAGRVTVLGHDVFALDRRSLQRLRGRRVALVPQNGGASLTPTRRIAAHFSETLRTHRPDLDRRARRARTIELLGEVGLPAPEAAPRLYPHQFSGGQQQRIALALAMSGDPDLLVLDEPTTGQDAVTRRALLSLLRALSARRGTTMLFVSHDLTAVAQLCDRIVVLYAGEIVEDGPAEIVLSDPRHPYTKALLASAPTLDGPPDPTAILDGSSGPDRAAAGCSFAPRCRHAAPACREHRPTVETVGPRHRVACALHEVIAVALPPASSGKSRATA
ncbi:ABC transporter ATP-binding protein [Segnochrobactrum spirostomi]|uniref:ABC transporter ATP-binding protein n=1 Tax=Segnochrobactrum spirostomi TaxID=2608987 RepID=UPI001AD83B3B|nr:ABC transporter ATP-binding protein [Segnochrobactrum spirostomi]